MPLLTITLDGLMVRKIAGLSALLLTLLISAQPSVASNTELLAAFRAHNRGDNRTAVPIFEKYAMGRPEAAFLLAGIYMDGGGGVAPNPREAVRLLTYHAQRGHSSSQYGLGLAYAGGRGVPQDFVQAHLWFNLAAASGDETMRRGGAERREQMARLMTPAQVAEAQRLAREWRPRLD